MSAFVAPIIGKCDNCGAELRAQDGYELAFRHPCPVCGGQWKMVPDPVPDPHADLRAALLAACKTGVIEGWRVANNDTGGIEWIVSMTTEQTRRLFVDVDGSPLAGQAEECSRPACLNAEHHDLS